MIYDHSNATASTPSVRKPLLTALLLAAAVAMSAMPTARAQACMTDADCDDLNPCTLDSCDLMNGCVNDAAARDGFGCDDLDNCTTSDVCMGGVCTGLLGNDSDGDGYCDIYEQQESCHDNDGAEIPPQPATFSGTAGGSPSNVLMTFLTPSNRKASVLNDPSCATHGVCGPLGFCTAGKIADPCTAQTAQIDCSQPPNTCRVVINYAAIGDLTLLIAELNHHPISGFAPLTPGCSRKVDVTVDPTRRSNRLKLKAQGTVNGRRKRDTDTFRFGK